VVDADLSRDFEEIPHSELMILLARRVVDKAVLHMVKMWLEAAVEEKDEKTGKIKRTTTNKDQRKGAPLGAPISPLMSNIYMHRVILE
jgi:retron-type reverse transcriptase